LNHLKNEDFSLNVLDWRHCCQRRRNTCSSCMEIGIMRKIPVRCCQGGCTVAVVHDRRRCRELRSSSVSRQCKERSPRDMGTSVSLEVRQQVEELNYEFAHRVDFGPAETTADLFVQDGWYAWGEKRSVGREAIREAYRQRAARGVRTARHLSTNLQLTQVNEQEVRGQSIMLIFAEDGPPPHPAMPLLVADVEDVYVRENGRWLFRSRRLTDVFTDPGRTAVLPLDSKRKEENS
jgi:hypothetical protein